jgi:hypothetical protein
VRQLYLTPREHAFIVFDHGNANPPLQQLTVGDKYDDEKSYHTTTPNCSTADHTGTLIQLVAFEISH